MTFVEYYNSKDAIGQMVLADKIAKKTMTSDWTVKYSWATGRTVPTLPKQAVIQSLIGIPASELFPER